MILLMLAQAAGTAPPLPSTAEAVAPIDFDLRTVKPASPDEIVVVAGRRDDQRVPPLTAFAPEPEGLPRAEAGLFGNVRGAVTAEQATFPDGTASNRVMLKLKIPF